MYSVQARQLVEEGDSSAFFDVSQVSKAQSLSKRQIPKAPFCRKMVAWGSTRTIAAMRWVDGLAQVQRQGVVISTRCVSCHPPLAQLMQQFRCRRKLPQVAVHLVEV